MRLAWHHLDVFTDRPFAGNPLAVFPDAAGLDPAWMPRVAAELGLSETAFVLPPAAGGTRRVRIFTPRIELPFAGHPTIGTAILLVELGLVPAEGEDARMTLEEGVGPVAVTVRSDGGRRLATLELRGTLETGPAPDPAEAAAVVGLETRDLASDEPVRASSAGVPYLLVPVRDQAALARARVDRGRWERTLARAWAPHLYVYTRDAGESDADLRARMFAPAMGIAEDPATGAAVAALAVALAVEAGDGIHRWAIDQGIEAGRPSRLVVEAEVRSGEVVALRLSGAAVRLSEGWMEIPD